jgi:hypothetical protein
MINVANLKPVHFQAFIDGRKRTERRIRRRIDPRLEKIELGELVVMLEIGTRRAFVATIRHVIRFDYDRIWTNDDDPQDRRQIGSYYQYAIRLQDVELLTLDEPVRKIQGWHRRIEP